MRPYVPSQDLFTLTKGWEGCVDHWYQDIGGVWTGWYGHVCQDPAMRLLYPKPFQPGLMESWLESDYGTVIRAMNGIPDVEWTQHGGDGLADAAFNCGVGVFAPMSTVGKRLRAGDWDGMADALLEWCHVRINGVVQVNQGLLNRRKAERILILSAVPVAVGAYPYEVCTAGNICNPDEIREIIGEQGVFARKVLENDGSVTFEHRPPPF